MIRHLTTLVLCRHLGIDGPGWKRRGVPQEKMRVCACRLRGPQAGTCVSRPPLAHQGQALRLQIKLPTFCHKKPVCATTVAYCARPRFTNLTPHPPAIPPRLPRPRLSTDTRQPEYRSRMIALNICI